MDQNWETLNSKQKKKILLILQKHEIYLKTHTDILFILQKQEIYLKTHTDILFILQKHEIFQTKFSKSENSEQKI